MSGSSPTRQLLLRLYWCSVNILGIDPRRSFDSIRGLPAFLNDLRRFRRQFNGTLRLVPCLVDRAQEGGSTKTEYFWQDLLVARWIFEAQPRKHVDVGSRVDGFVAHVASFREIEVLDIRPTDAAIPGITFRQADIMSAASVRALASSGGYCDSLSCLHVLEHVGLGRYGDPIDANGHLRALAHLAAILEPGGILYLSTPIGRERVEFNANRVFAPRTILDAAASNGLRLRRLMTYDARDGLRDLGDGSADADMRHLAGNGYTLALMTFTKAAASLH